MVVEPEWHLKIAVIALYLTVFRPNHKQNLKARPNISKISQHCWSQHVARVWPPCWDLLRHVATCWLLLALVGSNLKMVKIVHTSVDVAWCFTRLARFVQQCCARACALVRISIRNMPQHVATGWPPRATCCTQQCCDMLGLNVAIV